MSQTRCIVIIPAAQLAAANTAASVIDPAGSTNAFTAGLSATGASPATHYWCNWAMTSAERQTLEDEFQSAGIWASTVVYDLDDIDPAVGSPSAASVLATEGLQPVEESL